MKKIITLLLIFIMCISLNACGNVDEQTSNINKDTDTKNTIATTPTPEPTPVVTPTPEPTPEPISTIALGQKITTANYEFTLNKVELSYDVMPDNPPSYYTHYPADSGQVYIYVNASVKNLQKQDIRCDEIYSVTADFDNGYTYQGFNIITDTDGDFTYANINSVNPLQTLGVHCLVDCPQEIETSDKPLSLTITFKDNSQYKYVIR